MVRRVFGDGGNTSRTALTFWVPDRSLVIWLSGAHLCDFTGTRHKLGAELHTQCRAYFKNSIVLYFAKCINNASECIFGIFQDL